MDRLAQTWKGCSLDCIPMEEEGSDLLFMTKETDFWPRQVSSHRTHGAPWACRERLYLDFNITLCMCIWHCDVTLQSIYWTYCDPLSHLAGPSSLSDTRASGLSTHTQYYRIEDSCRTGNHTGMYIWISTVLSVKDMIYIYMFSYDVSLVYIYRKLNSCGSETEVWYRRLGLKS